MRRTTSLRTRTFSLIALIFLGLMVALSLPLRLFLLNSFGELEQQDTRLYVERVLGALSNELAGLSRTAADYASWDDTYQYVMDQNQDYVETNFVDDTFVNLRLSFLILVDARGQPVYSQGFDLAEGRQRPAPDELFRLPAADPLLRQADPDQNLSGVLVLPEGPFLVVARPILNSAYEGPARGTLVMGRALDGAELARLSETLRLPLALYSLDGAALPAHVEAARPSLATSLTHVAPLSDEVVAGYARLDDIQRSTFKNSACEAWTRELGMFSWLSRHWRKRDVELFSRPRGAICYKSVFLGSVVTADTLVQQLLDSQLRWYWESELMQPHDDDEPGDLPLVRPLAPLDVHSRAHLLDDLKQTTTFWPRRETVAFGVDAAYACASPMASALKSLIEKFDQDEASPLQLILRVAYNRHEYVFVPHSPVEPVRGLLGAWGLATESAQSARKYSSLRRDKLKNVSATWLQQSQA